VLAVLQVIVIVLVSVNMALALAHALELPGKLRLSRDVYTAVQPIYYPGFTIGGGIGEFGGILATVVLLIATPRDAAAFALTLAALVLLLIGHGIYWLVTHPVNQFWLRDQELKGAGRAFFSFGGQRSTSDSWTSLRNRWEYSHVARAVIALAALILLATSITLD
jgi:hypothetical protein